MTSLVCGKFLVDLSGPKVMGVINITPDSFSDGGRFIQPGKAIERALQMAELGAGFIDIGGESTRPGAALVSEQQELDRVLPVIEALAAELTIPLSIDTSKAKVMQAAVTAGASMINDVRALQQEDALHTAATCQVPVCLMHMQGEPSTMQQRPQYDDVVSEIIEFLSERIDACIAAGIQREQIIIDPGYGFGKTVPHNLQLVKQLQRFKTLNLPLLLGVSRKASIGQLLDADVEQRLAGSLAMATLGVANGANIIRAHDVKETVDALTIVDAVMAA